MEKSLSVFEWQLCNVCKPTNPTTPSKPPLPPQPRKLPPAITTIPSFGSFVTNQIYPQSLLTKFFTCGWSLLNVVLLVKTHLPSRYFLLSSFYCRVTKLSLWAKSSPSSSWWWRTRQMKLGVKRVRLHQRPLAGAEGNNNPSPQLTALQHNTGFKLLCKIFVELWRNACSGGSSGGSNRGIFGATKKGVFNKLPIRVCISFSWHCPGTSAPSTAFDGVLVPRVVPEATHRASLGSETETREFLGGTKVKSISQTRGHWLARQANWWFFTSLIPPYMIAP